MHSKITVNFSRALNLMLTGIFFLIAVTAFSQSNITGKVTDSTGNPLAGATVKIKGSNKATKTNEQGVFSLQGVTASSPVLVISYIGFADKEVKTTGTENLVISLAEKTAVTEEVIVTGVFDRRSALQSSIAISTLKSDAISKLAPTARLIY